MPEIKWIKITTSIFDNEKIKLIEAMPDKDSILIIWIKLIILAGKVNQGGNVYLSEDIPYTDEMLSTVFNRPLNTVRLALETFSRFDMIRCNACNVTVTNSNYYGLFIVNWGKYQSVDTLDKIREDTRLRVQKYRDKHPQIEAKSNSPESVTPSNVTVTLRNDIRDKKEDIRDKKEDIPYGQFQNVFLSDGELLKLKTKFGETDALDKIENVSEGIASKGYKVKSAYATILTWARLDAKKNGHRSSLPIDINKIPKGVRIIE